MRKMKKIISILLCTSILFLVTACDAVKKETAGQNDLIFTLDVNPSLEFSISSSNIIKSLKAVNDDGKIMLEDNNYTNKSFGYTAKKIIDDLVKDGYLNPADKSTILITFKSLQSEKTNKINEVLQSAIKESGCKAEVYTLYVAQEDDSVKKLAQESNISYGKAYFCSIVSESSKGSIQAQEIAQNNISQIKNTGEKHNVTVKQAVNQANKEMEKIAETTKQITQISTATVKNTTTKSPKTTKEKTTKSPKTTKEKTTRQTTTTTRRVTTTRATTTMPTTTKPPTTQDPIANRTPTADELEVLRLVNADRTKEGLHELQWSKELFRCAVVRADEQLIVFSHGRPNGTGCGSVFNQYGIPKHKCTTETLCKGQTSAYSPYNMHYSLMECPDHRAAIMNVRYTHIGIAIIHGSDGYSYLVEEFYG